MLIVLLLLLSYTCSKYMVMNYIRYSCNCGNNLFHIVKSILTICIIDDYQST